NYILKKYFKEGKVLKSGELDLKTYNKQKSDLLALFRYKDWKSRYEYQAQSRLSDLLRLYPKGHDTFRQLMIYFEHNQLIAPSYRTIQDMFTKAYSQEDERLHNLIAVIPKEQKTRLTTFITREEGVSRLNIIRSDQKDFKYTAIKDEVKKAIEITELYQFSTNFLPQLKLSKNTIRYYADLTEQYPASRLRRLKKPRQWLYALCFIYHRYQQIMDNLITSFMYHIKLIMEEGKEYATEANAKYAVSLTVELPNLANFLLWFPVRDKNLTYDEISKIAYGILPEKQFPLLAAFLKGTSFDKTAAEWKFYAKSSKSFALYLRPILLTVPFIYFKEGHPLMAMIDLLKTHYSSKKGPSSFHLTAEVKAMIPENMLQYLKDNPEDEKINPALFEFFVYKKMCHQLDRGRLCCNHSVSFADIEHELVDMDLVENVDKIATEFGFSKIPVYCDERLDDALKMLDETWDRTTQNIHSGLNRGFKIKETSNATQEWTLSYDSSEKLDDAFFRTLPKTEVAEVLTFMGNQVSMWLNFTHMKDRYTKKKKPTVLAVNACILADAFGFGVIKMAEICDLNISLLRSTHEDFIRIDTLCNANNRNANFIKTLPVFKLWNLILNKILADADGQKFSTSNSTIQSRYSTKYLGKGTGISLYTLVANFVAVNAKTIGLNEYEGHSLYDMIYGNKTDIAINMVTGDNHSLNQLNFVTLDSIDVEYVPCIKNIREAANELYSAKSPDEYKGIIKPKGKINVARIKSEKKNILRVLLSLLLQENTQANIIRKLNSHARYARLKVALIEYNKIFKTIHILNLIDDMSLRKAIRTARNRTEAYHQLQGTIRKVYHGVFKGKKVVDNRISAHAVRLIANCIIGYNSIILNNIYEKMIEDGVSQAVLDEFARISPIAWAHIVFAGQYSFKKTSGIIDILAMTNALERHLKQSFWMADRKNIS
ncbi:MAG: hypothetical protein QG556_790, partial [Pseudomonadota bacterium]|nr:hypothetical protein [Pseudomonadota bacterium]